MKSTMLSLIHIYYLAYMLKYDTMHGQFNGTIEADVENSKLIVNGQAIRITAERNPADLKWNEVGAEYLSLIHIYLMYFKIKTDSSHFIYCFVIYHSFLTQTRREHGFSSQLFPT